MIRSPIMYQVNEVGFWFLFVCLFLKKPFYWVEWSASMSHLRFQTDMGDIASVAWRGCRVCIGASCLGTLNGSTSPLHSHPFGRE